MSATRLSRLARRREEQFASARNKARACFLIVRCLNADRTASFAEMSYEFEHNLRRVKTRLKQKASRGIERARRSLSLLSGINGDA